LSFASELSAIWKLHVPEATADEQREAGLWTVESIALGLKMRWWANSIVKNI
jgi:hypothetical protein